MFGNWRLANDRSGATAVEFALAAPVLFALVMGIGKFGITFNNYIMLTEAASAGARQLAVSRGVTTPRTNTVNIITSAATGLTTSNLGITLTVNGAACNVDTSCASAMTNAANSPARVTLSYPCDLRIYGVDFAPGCTLSSTRVQRIE